MTPVVPLSLPDVALLVALVNPGGRSRDGWPSKVRIILALATFVDGGWFNSPDAELLTGIKHTYAKDLLRDLEAQRVIRRDGGHGPRAKLYWCEVNPDWRQWDVEWSMEPRQIEARLAHNRAERALQPLQRLFSRRIGPRFHRVIAVLGNRANQREMAPVDHFARYLGTAIPAPQSRVLQPRKSAHPAKEVSLLAGDDETSSSSMLARAQEEEGRQHPGWGRVRHAYARKVGVKVLYGAPSVALARLVATHGDDDVLRAIDRAPGELGVALLVEQLPDLIAGDEPIMEAPIVVDVEARVTHLRRMMATYEANDAEPPQSLVEELAEWQTVATAPQEVPA